MTLLENSSEYKNYRRAKKAGDSFGQIKYYRAYLNKCVEEKILTSKEEERLFKEFSPVAKKVEQNINELMNISLLGR